MTASAADIMTAMTAATMILACAADAMPLANVAATTERAE